MNPKHFMLMIVALLLAIVADARNADGTLGLIRVPNDGFPATVLPGQQFDAVLLQEATLSIETPAGEVPLQATWKQRPGGRVAGKVSIPDSVAPGLYTLKAVSATSTDVSVRSVWVTPNIPRSYVLAHITDTHIGSGRHKRTSEEIFTDVIAALNKSEATCVVVTGDVTENGAFEQYQHLVQLLNTITLPTFVCAGNHDRDGLNYEAFFEPHVYSFRVGEDAYLSYDTKDFAVAPGIGEQDTELEIQRRAIKSARWSIGLSHRYETSQGMRSQLILFVDNPLDYLIFGHWHRENRPNEQEGPWGTTPYTVTPAAVNGSMRLFDIGPGGIEKRPFEKVAAIE